MDKYGAELERRWQGGDREINKDIPSNFFFWVWEFITKYIQMACNGSLSLFPATIRRDSRGASGMIQLNNNLK